jgi:hypothetical protein
MVRTVLLLYLFKHVRIFVLEIVHHMHKQKEVTCMKKFMLLFVGLPLEETEDIVTQAYMKKWGKWIAGLAKTGVLESGVPFEPEGKVITRDVVSDYQSQGSYIGGYMLINAISLNETIEVAKQAPHMALGGTTIVRPCIEINV